MVLPPPAPDLEQGARRATERLLRLLKLGHGGTLLLAVGGTAWVGRLWRALATQGEPVFAAPHPAALERAPAGALVLYQAESADADWLNVHRPLFETRSLRVVVLATADVRRVLRRDAKDFYDWFSHTVLLPEAPFRHVVASLQAGLVGAVGWSGPGLDLALPWVTAAPVRTLPAALPWDRWAAERATSDVLIVEGVGDEAARSWVTRATAGRGGLVFREGAGVVSVAAPGWSWREAVGALAPGAVAEPAATVAALDLEPAALAAAHPGLDLAAEDPVVEEARAHDSRAGVIGMRAFPEPIVVVAEVKVGTVEGAERLLATGRAVEAERVAREALVGPRSTADSVLWAVVLADALVALGRSTEADQVLADAAARTEAPPEAERGAVELRLARAVCLERQGTLAIRLGRSAGALERLEEAVALGEELADEGEAVLARAHAGLGELHEALGGITEALAHQQEAFHLVERLANAAPQRAEVQCDLAGSFNRLGDLHRVLGDGDEARKLYESALDIATRLAENETDRADCQRALSVSYVKLGDLHQDLGDSDEAGRFYRAALNIARRLATNEPGRADHQRVLSVAYERLGDVHHALGDGDEAGRFYREALNVARGLATNEPDRVDYQRVLSVCYNKIGDLRWALEDADEARRYYQSALDVARRLATNEPDRADLQRDLALAFERMAAVDPAQAGGWLGQALVIRRAALEHEPSRATLRRELAVTLLQRGQAKPVDDELFREGATLLVSLRNEGKLETRYWPAADQLMRALQGATSDFGDHS